MKSHRTVLTLGAIALAVALVEIAVRVSGIADFPLYEANSEIGYIPAPSQSGDFLRKNHWQFNSKSMAGPEFAPSEAVDTLLIGDSVVLGGNPYKEGDRLGPQLKTMLRHPVWSVSAGSWSLRNELKYLKLHPEVAGAVDEFVFVVNNGDFDEASSWSCEKTHPRTRPLWASLYVFRKYVWDWETCGQVPGELAFPKGSWKPELRAFLASDGVRNKPVVFMLYPEREEAEGKKSLVELESRSAVIFAEGGQAASKVSVFSVAKDSRWNPTFYRDGIHPTVDGTRVLAEIIAKPQRTSELPR